MASSCDSVRLQVNVMSAQPSTTLPVFGNPPVVEVALSVMFEPLPAYRAAHAGLLGLAYGGFPVIEEHPELDLPIEEPGRPQAPPVPKLAFLQVPKVRTWFRTEAGTQLIQVQHNRFAYNWRRGETSEPYPRYSAVRAQFDDAFGRFRAFVVEHRLGTVMPVQAEVTYVNHIAGEHGHHSKVADLMQLWRGAPSGRFLPELEDARLLVQYSIPDAAGNFLGRLSANLQPGYVRATAAQILSLTLTARGRPLTPDIDGAFGFLDIGHEWIVRGFAEITTPEMHQLWERKR
jgi:uncharacterized protein (TIGR04255 family)